jgi:2-polyprenyl-3-methyl-5-hydroxy-6-metoxy-1,4-benzoquinol methylase
MKQTGKIVQEFYNRTPFPDYELDNFNTKEDLELAAYPFSQTLNESIPEEASIMDVGTGTGQLSAFLSLHRKNVCGIDFTEASLNKARALKAKLNLKSWHLKKVDILDKEQIEAIDQKFDYVLCLGVLHHTGNAYLGFQNILKLLKPKGYIGVGLYNKFGRLPLKMRMLLARTVFKNNTRMKDYFIKLQIGNSEDKERERGWWNDQYLHPHETTHTVGEVLRWFGRNGIRYSQTVPSLDFNDTSDLEVAGVWNDDKYPNVFKRWLKQLCWIYKTHREGGYWITFGKKV